VRRPRGATTVNFMTDKAMQPAGTRYEK